MKILIVDIETSPHLSYHFGRWQENISPEKTIDESHIICWAAKWAGKKKVHFMSEWGNGLDEMLSGIYDLLDEADAVVTFNGNKFDIKRLNAEFLLQGWSPPSPYDSIDLFVQAKKHFAFSSNRLKHLLKRLGLSPKLEENTDIQLWIDTVHWKKPIARKRMKLYNIQDVRSTEEFYNYLLGWITPHPNWALFVDDRTAESTKICPNCGSTKLHKHKVRRTKVRKYQQYQCQDCGKYSRGRKNIGLKGTKNGILV